MATFIINRQHAKPDNEEHAAMCWRQEKVEGDLVTAKLAMLDMIYRNEVDPARQRVFITGLVMLDSMDGRKFVSWTDPRGLRYSIGTE